MRKTLFIVMILVSLLLTGCAKTEITCGEGLKMVDGVCIIDKTEEEPKEDDVVENPTVTCEMNIDDYGVSNYEMVWNDEFDYEGELDETKWEYLIGNGGSYGIPGWGNNEKQYYSKDSRNVEVKDGLLRITASTYGFAQYDYTSGRVRTMNSGDFKYGVVEVCAKMPDTKGTWPAIWMLPTDSPYGIWPNGGEIDIMEAVGFEKNTVHFNIHTKNDNWGTSRSIGSHSTINAIATEYHRYAIKWVEDEITFYVDGVERFSYEPVADSYEYWPFDTEFHLILNIAVGGTWGGQRGIEEGSWEDSMYVDYVRVYQEK